MASRRSNKKPKAPKAKRTESRVRGWLRRALDGEKRKKVWDEDFQVKTCKDFYLGRHYMNPLDENDEEKIQINLVGAAVRAALPGLSYYFPRATINTKPERADTPASIIDKRARLLEDTANSIVKEPETRFLEQTSAALKEAFWAFACVETGHSAEFEETAQAKHADAPLAEGEEAAEDFADEDVPDMKSESFYVRRIPAAQVILSERRGPTLDDCDWIGYWEWMNIEDIREAAAYKESVRKTVTAKDQKKEEGEKEAVESSDRARIFKLWDLRTRKRYVFSEDADASDFLLEREWTRFPLHFARFETQPDEFFPIPPIYHMLLPQKEYNHSRDTLRRLRDGIKPRWEVDKKLIDPEEVEKFEDDEVGTYVWVNSPTGQPAIRPVTQLTHSEGALRTLTVSRQEFDGLSGVGAEQRQVAESDTATQAQLVARAGAVQNSYNRQAVANWLADIIKGLLQAAIDDMALDRWILRNVDIQSPQAQAEALEVAEAWKQITFQDLKEAGTSIWWDVSVDVESLSPVTENEKQQQWNNTMRMIAEPAIARILATSPELLKKTLTYNGVHSGAEHEMIGKALQTLFKIEMQMAQQGAKGTPSPGGAGQGGPAGNVGSPPNPMAPLNVPEPPQEQ